MEVGKFATNLIIIIVGVVLVTAVALPILSGVTIAEGTPNKGAIESMLGIVPILLVVAIVMAVIYMFISRRE